jgi:hypothetical protein
MRDNFPNCRGFWGRCVVTESRRAADMNPRKQEFRYRGRLPVGHWTVLAGPPDLGKSAAGYAIAAEIDVPTIFITVEEVDETAWLPKLLAAGVDPKKAFHHPEVVFAPGKAEYLGELIRLYEARLVVVDPLTNHLLCSISHDQRVREILVPYERVLQRHECALFAEVHILSDVKANAHPLMAVPAGVRSVAKAVFLFSRDPRLGADENARILASAKFNFGPPPRSLQFMLDTKQVPVVNKQGQTEICDYPSMICLGEVAVSAKQLLVTLRPEDKDRKGDRAAFLLVQLLADGPVAVSELKRIVAEQDPPLSWKTMERVAHGEDGIGVIESDHPHDKRKKLWSLPASAQDAVDEAGIDGIQIEEVDLPDVADTFPENWTDDDGVA